ncbi:PIN domain-containing protein [Ramlibacter sp. 2FC]|uniref:PIN domain-containing protein n=1 Tax=Ramlibacter sp. 2FC TaxID=2502188 RepID=UPI0010F77605|nr:PIN domain-containing protein [Ramlibacter sp. 2FC]
MAGHPRYTALLDACVLYPIAVCDALMSVAGTGIYAARWTARIDDEWTRNLAQQRGVPQGSFDTRRDAMHDACPDWEVPAEAWQPLEPCIEGLPDPDDRHVLAAAIAGHADCIVTVNLKDFPAAVVAPLGIEILHPDSFLVAQLDLEPLRVLPAFKAMRARLRNPTFTPDHFAETLEAKYGLVETAHVLRQASELI